jgi:hypothetical protein
MQREERYLQINNWEGESRESCNNNGVRVVNLPHKEIE